MTQQPLFDKPNTPAVSQARALHHLGTGKPTWARYRPQHRQQCVECVWVLHEAEGVGAPIRAARWRLTVEGSSYLLCTAHADLRRGGKP